MAVRAVCVWVLLSYVSGASAQDTGAAAAAYAQGQQAALRGDPATAAALFELADQAAPTPQALRSAIRSHRDAGHLARAATLSLAALRRYAEEPETTALAHSVLEVARRTLGRVHILCRPACSLTIDGGAANHEPIESYDGFHDPGERVIRATWPDRDPVETSVTLAAGHVNESRIDAPAPATQVVEAVEPEPEAAPAAAPSVSVVSEPEPVAEDSGGLHPALFFTALGVAVVGGAVVTWSGLDVLGASHAYTENPTREAYDDGVGRELRTNLLIAGTATAAATAILLAVFTDWGGDRDTSLSLDIEIGSNAAFARIVGVWGE